MWGGWVTCILQNKNQANRWRKPQTEADVLGNIPTRTRFLFLFVLLLLMKTDSENKRKTWNQNTTRPAVHRGDFGLTQLVSLLLAGWAPESLRSCPHLPCSETGGCLCRHESLSSDSMDRGQGSGWQGGDLWGGLCALMGAWLILETQRVALLAGTWTTNLSWGDKGDLTKSSL